MPRQKLGPRVNGPYFDVGTAKYKLRVYTSYADKGSDLYYETEKEAQKAKAKMEKELSVPTIPMIGQMLVEFITEKEQSGRAKTESCRHQLRALRAFFWKHLNEDISWITSKRASVLYEEAVTTPTPNGQARSSATHRFYLKLAQGFCNWAVRKGYRTENPFQSVEPVGHLSAGKKQLRVEEARVYAETAFQKFDKKKDVMALASVVPLYLGLRASEVLKRKVRDLDNGGALLWIDGGKTKNARRHLKIEAKELQVRLVRLAQGRNPEEPLFGYGATGKPRRYQALWVTTQRICKAAGVPAVCPHSFRGLWATLSVESGAASSAVATALGHGTFAVTARHYAQPEALSNARSARVMDLLRFEENSNSEEPMNPEQIIERLSPAALKKLSELIQKQPPSPVE